MNERPIIYVFEVSPRKVAIANVEEVDAHEVLELPHTADPGDALDQLVGAFGQADLRWVPRPEHHPDPRLPVLAAQLRRASGQTSAASVHLCSSCAHARVCGVRSSAELAGLDLEVSACDGFQAT